MRYSRFALLVPICAFVLALAGCNSAKLVDTNSTGASGQAPQVTAVGIQTNGVAPNRWQYVQFNEAMDASTINNQTFVVTDSSGMPMAGTVSYYADFRVAGFEPNPALQDEANYTATITTGVASAQGVHLAAPYAYTFVTRDSTDLSPLYVANVTPAPNATCVSATSRITITFSEGADISTVNSTNIVITGPGGAVISAQINYDVATAIATLTPAAPLPSGTITVTVQNVADAAGVPMTVVYGWSFQTSCTQSAASFTVISDIWGGTGTLVMDRLGDLYGTTDDKVFLEQGIVFKLDPSGNGTFLYGFKGGSDGGDCHWGVVLDSSGNIYGTTAGGGSSGLGTVFKLDPSGNETVLHSFTGGPGDGESPWAPLVMDSSGNLYGTTTIGGASGFGTVFKLDPAGNETVLYSFKGSDGAHPEAGLIRDSSGNLYGTTKFGGSSGEGTVFKLDPSGNETVLHSFKGSNDAASPRTYGSLVMDSAGNLYGTTPFGGSSGAGTVFKLDPSGNETVLHSFTGSAGDGEHPEGGLVRDSAGNLYGTAAGDGILNHGVVFKVDPSGNETVLHSFTSDEGRPYPGLFMDPAGNLYGTTFVYSLVRGGNKALVFKITP